MKGQTKICLLDGEKAKTLLNSERLLVGFAGSVSHYLTFLEWVLADDNTLPPKLSKLELLALNQKGQIFHGEGTRRWTKIAVPYFSIGTGMTFALGAMESGKSPLEAVKIASKYDTKTGMGFKEYFIN